MTYTGSYRLGLNDACVPEQRPAGGMDGRMNGDHAVPASESGGYGPNKHIYIYISA